MNETIPEGHVVMFSSWENDGDAPFTITNFGWTGEDLNLATILVIDLEDRTSNIDDLPSDDLYEIVFDALNRVLEQNPVASGPLIDELRETVRLGVEENWNKEDVGACFYESLTRHIYGEPVDDYYSYSVLNFLRKIESIKVATIGANCCWPRFVTKVYSRYS